MQVGVESSGAEGKLRLFVAIGRTSKFAFVELHRKAGKAIAAQLLRNLIGKGSSDPNLKFA
jgi:hypothetical protein